MKRVNPIEGLDEFKPKAPGEKTRKPVERDVIERIAEDNGFPSRQPQQTSERPTVRSQRRYVTGRNRQINIKATTETIERLYRKADELKVPLGEVLDRALTALEAQEST
ncbi:stability/partitioning determinant [Paraburkholderia sp. UYCP14C]|uniref:stability/partitioning determinant n=1 Tax=Paraburkholderia sp. UYCP14C TaxID=2511130 RepID=UPI001020622E|nr:stability/partitioning determinant [Paraburkholderia sp. UYCP14C]RZF25876.1 stability/partitioning determinant [Paraburkholderia sp. UYCP14C]